MKRTHPLYPGLSVRVGNALYYALLSNRETIRQAVESGDVLRVRNIGWHGYIELCSWLGLPKPYKATAEYVRSGLRAQHREIVKYAMVFLSQSSPRTLAARLHGLMHTMPEVAKQAGFPSLRSSARHCGVSVEWIRRCRDRWCDTLGVLIPSKK